MEEPPKAAPRAPQPFVEQKFDGGRFKNNGIPVEVLATFEAYRELVFKLAREKWLEKHKAARVPNGYEDKFRLELVQLKKGSADTALARVWPSSEPLFPNVDEFDGARDLVNETIGAAVSGHPLPEAFPAEFLADFEHIGEHLRDDEWCDFRAPGNDNSVRYDRRVRARLLAHAKITREASIDLEGRVCGLNVKKRTFEVVVLPDGNRAIEGRCSPAHLRTLRGALGEEEIKVHVIGLGQLDGNGRLQRILEVHQMTAVQEEAPHMNVDERLAELEALEAGWLDGKGLPLDRAGVGWVRQVLRALKDAHRVRAPYLYPTPEGGVQAEWTFGDWETSATFPLPERSAHLFAAHVKSEAIDSADPADDDAPTLAKSIATFLERFSRSAEPWK